MAEVRVTATGAGHEVPAAALVVGDVLAVELPENRTTGYVWSADAVPEQLVELAEAPPDEAGRPPGAGRSRVLRFAAARPGAGELRLRQGRPWQPARSEMLVVPVRVEAVPAGSDR